VDQQYHQVCLDEWYECRLQIKDLRGKFGYKLRELPLLRTRASNERGHGPYSDVNFEGGLIQTEPEKMN